MKQIIHFIKQLLLIRSGKQDLPDWQKPIVWKKEMTEEERDRLCDEQDEFWKGWYGE